MMSKLRELKLLFPLVLFLALVFFLSRNFLLKQHSAPSPLIDHSVPTFEFPNVFDPKKNITDHIFFDHVTVLNVFATWCVPCRAEHAALMRLHENHRDVQLVGIAYKDSREKVLLYLKKYGNPFNEVIADPHGLLSARFDVESAPETLVIDEQGIIRNKIIGPMSPEIVKDQLMPLIRNLQKAK